MEQFDDKKVPTVASIEDLTKESTQDDLCISAVQCNDEDIDCGECLFSDKFCAKNLFEHWKLQKLEQLKDE